jgi:PAS domain S-box-containing protein
MTYFMVSVYSAYAASNLLLALIILIRSRRNQISQFYFFCVSCLVVLGGFAVLLSSPMHPVLRIGLHHTVVFFYALFPFFFIHFITIFLRRNDVTKSTGVVLSIYGVGLFAYAMVLAGYIPKPVSLMGEVGETGNIFYVTWMSIFFSIGVAMLFELSGKFREKVKRANVLFISFTLLMLVLPGPFTESVFFKVLGLSVTWYFYICTSALVVAVYFIFRHKIIANTIYDALRTALAVMNDVLIVLNENFQIEMIRGNAVSKLLGYRESDLAGKSLGTLLGQEDSLEEYRADVMSGKTREMYFDADVLSKDGKRFPMNFSITPVYVDNELGGFVSIARDITDRKHLEEELRQAQKMESLGTLAGGIAHDFNNILQIILVNTSSLKRKVLDAEKVNQVVDINTKAVQRGAGLVQQVLMFARKTEVQFNPLNLNGIIEDIKKMLAETFPKTITFSVSLNDQLPPIVGDQGQVHQVLLNLCVNARDAMPNGGHIFIGSDIVMGWAVRKKFVDAQDQQYVCITVTDTGQGMPESVRARIFEPFFTTKEKGKGTGLGLAVVYGIITAHKGFIEVQSDVGVGTTFKVYFPIATDTQKPAEEQGDGHEQVTRGAETILVVEDEEVLLQSLELLLGSQGYSVLSARDGYEAVEIFRQNKGKISLIILDIGLPKLNGWDAYAKMREINPRIKCIISSGYLDPIMKSGRIDPGAENFILKPYDPSEILKQVRKVLDQTPA